MNGNPVRFLISEMPLGSCDVTNTHEMFSYVEALIITFEVKKRYSHDMGVFSLVFSSKLGLLMMLDNWLAYFLID